MKPRLAFKCNKKDNKKSKKAKAEAEVMKEAPGKSM
jgi:hypothetical protein